MRGCETSWGDHSMLFPPGLQSRADPEPSLHLNLILNELLSWFNFCFLKHPRSLHRLEVKPALTSCTHPLKEEEEEQPRLKIQQKEAETRRHRLSYSNTPLHHLHPHSSWRSRASAPAVRLTHWSTSACQKKKKNFLTQTGNNSGVDLPARWIDTGAAACLVFTTFCFLFQTCLAHWGIAV